MECLTKVLAIRHTTFAFFFHRAGRRITFNVRIEKIVNHTNEIVSVNKNTNVDTVEGM